MAELKFCASCGAKRQSEAAFCVQCGEKLPRAQEPTRILLIACVLLVGTGALYLLADRLAPSSAEPTGIPAAHGHEHDHDHQADDQMLAALKKRAGSGDTLALLELAEKFIELSPTHPEYLSQSADTLSLFLNHFPKHAYSLRLLASVLSDMEMPERALPFYERYLELHADDAVVQADYGTQLLSVGQANESIPHFKSAIATSPDFYLAHYHLSLAYKEIGDQSNAQLYADKANDIETRLGRVMPRVKDIERLPGDHAHGNMAAAEGAAPVTAAPASGVDSTYAPLESYFRQHQIVGPKMAGFRVEDGKAVLLVRAFPMSAMPPFARDKFDTSVKTELAKIGGEARLEIRDADNGQVQAEYGGE